MPYSKIFVNNNSTSLNDLRCNNGPVYLAYMDGDLVYVDDNFPLTTIEDNRYNNGKDGKDVPIYTCKGLKWVTISTWITKLLNKDANATYTFNVNFGPGELMGGSINSGASTTLYSYQWIELVFTVNYKLDKSGNFGDIDGNEIAFNVSAKLIGHNPGGQHDLWYKNFPSNGDFDGTITKIQNQIVAYIEATDDHNDLYLKIQGGQEVSGDGSGDYNEGGTMLVEDYLTYNGAMNDAHFSSLVTAPNEARYIRMLNAMKQAETVSNPIFVKCTGGSFSDLNASYVMVLHRLPE